MVSGTTHGSKAASGGGSSKSASSAVRPETLCSAISLLLFWKLSTNLVAHERALMLSISVCLAGVKQVYRDAASATVGTRVTIGRQACLFKRAKLLPTEATEPLSPRLPQSPG
jgi:hypothetical protein